MSSNAGSGSSDNGAGVGYDQDFSAGWLDALLGRERRWPKLKLRASANLDRIAYDRGWDAYWEANQATPPFIGPVAQLSAAQDEPHWACLDCGRPCRCSLPGLAHTRCGFPDPEDKVRFLHPGLGLAP